MENYPESGPLSAAGSCDLTAVFHWPGWFTTYSSSDWCTLEPGLEPGSLFSSFSVAQLLHNRILC